MSTELAHNEIVEAAKLSWMQFGMSLPDFKNGLAQQENQILATISVVPSTESIAECEANLAEAKKMKSALISFRKEKSDKLDQLKSKFMMFEKTADEKIKEYEQMIIGVKKQIQEAQNAVAAKQDEHNRYVQAIKRAYINYNHEGKKMLQDLVDSTYKNLLDNDVPFQEYDNKLAEVQVPVLGFNQFYNQELFTIHCHTQDELKAIFEQHQEQTIDFVSSFVQIMQEKKIGYKSHLANKEEAAKALARQAAEAAKKAEAEKESKQMEVKIESADVQQAIPSDPPTKKLKVTYVVDMPETAETALQLWACFAGNKEKVMEVLNVKKWLSCTPKQIGTALSKLKTQDPGFEFSGIIFKEKSKL
jgi:hypothetical protein